MATLVMCRNRECGELFEVEDSAAGSSVRCPSCGLAQSFHGDGGAQSSSPRGEDGPANEAPDTAGQSERKSPPKKPIRTRQSEPADAPEPESPTAGEPMQADDERLTLQAMLEDVQPEQAYARSHSAGAVDAPGDLPDWAKPSASTPTPSDRRTSEPSGHVATIATPPPCPANLPAIDESELSRGGFRNFDQDAQASLPAVKEDLGRNVLAVGVFGVGLAGLLAGAGLGAGLGGEAPLAWVYLGALAGWAGGFVLAFLAYLGVCPEQVGRVPCPSCACRMDRDEPQCSACGRTLQWADIYPMTVGCCRALQVAASHWPRLLGLAAVGLLPTAVWALRTVLFLALPEGIDKYQPFLVGGLVLTSLVAMAVWLRVLLQVGNPFPFRWAGRANVLTACKAVGVVVLYTLPMVTLALLPIRLLQLIGLKVPGGIGERFRRLAACANDYALLWLWLMLYAATGLLTIALYAALAWQIPLPLDPTQTLPAIGRIAVMTLAFFVPLALAALFATAMFCCIGAFGRQNAIRLIQPAAGG
jgi:hypothetical protein